MKARMSKITFDDFSGGYNDTATPYKIKQNELSIGENCDITKTIGGLPIRKGTSKINDSSYNGEITRRIEYYLKLDTRKVIVIDKVVNFDDGTTLTPIITVDIDRPHFIQRQEVLYISDNTNLYEYGQKDYFSNIGVVDIKTDDIVQVSDDYTTTSIRGNFYKAKADYVALDLKTEDYTVTARWEDATDIKGVISNVTRTVKAFDPSRDETFTLTITDGATTAGTLEVTTYVGEDKTITSVAVASSDSQNQVATKLGAGAYTGYTVSVNQNIVTFTATAKGYATNAVFQPYSTGVGGFIDVVINGVDDDNQINEVRKCERIILHTKSARYVASGNPDKPTTIYFSEPNQINYWKEFNELIPTSSDGVVKAMFNIVSSVVVSYNHTWWEYSGTNPATNAEWRQLPIPFGCEAEWTVRILDYYNFIYLAKDGLYVVSTNILTQEGVPTQDSNALRNVSALKVNNTINAITDKSKCVATFDNDTYYMAYNDDETIPRNNKVLCYFTYFKAYTKHTGIYVNDFLATASGEIEIASKNFSLKTNSSVFLDVDIETGGTKPIHLKLASTKLTFGFIEERKWFEKMFIHFVQVESQQDADVDIKVAINNSEKNFSNLTITPSLVWGKSWGALWGFQELLYYFAYIRRRGTWIKWEIETDSTGSDIQFYGVTFLFKKLRAFTTNYVTNPIS